MWIEKQICYSQDNICFDVNKFLEVDIINICRVIKDF